MLKKTVIDLSKPKDHPKRKRVVTLSAEEETAKRSKWAKNKRAAQEAAASQAEIDEMLKIRKELIDARISGNAPDPLKITRYNTLRARHPDAN